MPTVAEVLVDTLQAAGVRIVFGLPGGETLEALDAIRRRGLSFVLVHNEASAVFMADSVARLTGVPGVALTTLGPGATNAVVGVGHAYLDRSPVILLTAQKPDALLPGYTHQVIDLHALFQPITKSTVKLGSQNVAEAAANAIHTALAGRPGPVHLQLSNEDAALPAADLAVTALTLPSAPAPNLAGLDNASAALAAARRPIIVAGLGLEPQQPYAALRELAESAQAPVIVTPKAKGALPDDHPLAAGVIGLTRTDPAYEILDDADCIIAVGFDVVELVRPWSYPAPLIWIAPWPNHDPVLPSIAEFSGAMAPVLARLAGLRFETAPDWGVERVTALRRKQAAAALPAPQPGRILPQSVLAVLRRHTPRTSPMLVDVGSHKIFGSLSWPAYTPNRFFLSNGLSSMGFAFPAAIGAGLALQGEPVICLTGDAGFAMVMGELGVLAQLQLPVLVVVLNDSAIDLIRSQQVRAGKPVFGTEFRSPDFCQIARAYGLAAIRVTSEVELDEAVRHAIASRAPRVIEVMLDPISYPTTPRS
jgi:acetolactate synthase-1/2/3 large subunit